MTVVLEDEKGEPPQDLENITQLLRTWRGGDPDALNRVLELAYQDLRRTARCYLRGPSGDQTLQPTALVHEVYGRLMGGKIPLFKNREHFFRCARLIMRQVLVKQARMRESLKRGKGERPLPLDEELVCFGQRQLAPSLIIAIDKALDQLQEVDPRKRQIVELRFFLGLSVEETADVLGLSSRTIRRDWRTAQSWLANELGRESVAE